MSTVNGTNGPIATGSTSISPFTPTMLDSTVSLNLSAGAQANDTLVTSLLMPTTSAPILSPTTGAVSATAPGLLNHIPSSLMTSTDGKSISNAASEISAVLENSQTGSASASAASNSTGSASLAANLVNVGPKRLHVSNIPFRFREADLRQLLGVSRHVFLCE